MYPPQIGVANIPTMAPNYNDQYGNHQGDPPVDSDFNLPANQFYGDDGNSVASVKSALMGGAQNRLKQKRMKNM